MGVGEQRPTPASTRAVRIGWERREKRERKRREKVEEADDGLSFGLVMTKSRRLLSRD
jgi:hypothetical protein